MASQTLATFPLRNTSDAIRLLDQAEVTSDDRTPAGAREASGPNSFGGGSSRPHFFLLQEGLIDEATLFRLFQIYLNSIHPIMPLIPYERIPITPEHVVSMAGREPHFMAAALVITAALSGDQALHDLLWQRVQRVFAEVAINGTNESLEVIEGLLLLSGAYDVDHLLRVWESDILDRISPKHGSQHKTRIRGSNVLGDCRHGELVVLDKTSIGHY